MTEYIHSVVYETKNKVQKELALTKLMQWVADKSFTLRAPIRVRDLKLEHNRGPKMEKTVIAILIES